MDRAVGVPEAIASANAADAGVHERISTASLQRNTHSLSGVDAVRWRPLGKEERTARLQSEAERSGGCACELAAPATCLLAHWIWIDTRLLAR